MTTSHSVKSRQGRRTLGVIALLALALGTSACTGPATVAATPSAAESAAPTTSPSQKAAAASPELPDTVYADRVSDADRAKLIKALGKQHVVLNGKTSTNAHGAFPQLSIDKKSPLATFDKSTLTEALPAGWTSADATAAQQYAANFMLQALIDTGMNGDTSTKTSNEWAKEYGPHFREDLRQDIIELVKQPKGLVEKQAWQEEDKFTGINYSYVYDGLTPRLTSLDTKILSTRGYEGAFVTYYSGQFVMDAYHEKGKTRQATDYTMTLAVKKAKGKFSITGIQVDFETKIPIAVGKSMKQVG